MKHYSEFQKQNLEIMKKRQKNGGSIQYYEPSFSDTETSKTTHFERIKQGKKTVNVEKVNDTWVYIWGISIGKEIYYGRYLHEFFEFLQLLIRQYKISKKKKFIIYFHNLAYDISYMWSLIRDYLGGITNALFVSPQHPITVETESGIVFKCSYKLVNKSLDNWSKDLNIEHKKLTGTKDYTAVYYPSDDLPKNELEYFEYDILSLKECFYKELEIRGYNFINVPLTVTGFVRKEFTRAYLSKENIWQNRNYFEKAKLNDDQYNRLVLASMGGITEGNYRRFGQTISNDDGIGHADFDSHYPTQQICKMQPHQPFTVYDEIKKPREKKPTMHELKFYLKRKQYFIVDIDLLNLKLKPGVTMPFISLSKCHFYPETSIKKDVNSINGRIISVNGTTRLCVTNFDLEIYLEQYHIDGYVIHAIDTYTTRKLPPYMTDTIKYFYKEKTRLKELENHLKDIKAPIEEIQDTHRLLMLRKGMLNSIFGCTYTKIKRDNLVIDLKNYTYTVDKTSSLDDYYEKFTSCMCYQLGVWTTALARYELYHIIKDLIGYENILYCDTDSAFFIPTEENIKRINEYNEKCRLDSEKNGYYVDYESYDGTIKRKYFHKFDFEKDHCKSKTFRYLHAKCYGLEVGGELNITVAGVPPRSLYNGEYITREEELGKLDNLKNGFIFKKCGGTRADYSTIRDYNGFSGGGCAILNTTNELHDVICNDLYFYGMEEKVKC